MQMHMHMQMQMRNPNPNVEVLRLVGDFLSDAQNQNRTNRKTMRRLCRDLERKADSLQAAKLSAVHANHSVAAIEAIEPSDANKRGLNVYVPVFYGPDYISQHSFHDVLRICTSHLRADHAQALQQHAQWVDTLNNNWAGRGPPELFCIRALCTHLFAEVPALRLPY